MPSPNFVFILLDDLGYKDLSCYGSTYYETPNLDRLAGDSALFTDAYASSPLCSPTRASILTGRYPARVGITNYIDWSGRHHPARGRLIDAPYVNHLPLQEHTLASALRAGGYRTYHVGKWHLGGEPYWPEKQGFDVNVAGCEWGMPLKGYFSPYQIPTLVEGPPGQYLTDRLTDEAIALLEKNGSAPFFLYLAYYAVHIPIQAKEDDKRRFAQKAHDTGLDTVQALVEGEPYPCDHKKHLRVTRRAIQSDPAYAAMVWNVDENVGRLLKALEEFGLAKNTVVIFTSDNGGLATAEGSPTSNAPLAEGKGWMYEGGTREPLLVRWPGRVAAGSVCTTPVTSPDFYPTMLEMAGADLIPQQHCDGVSMLPLLEGRSGLDRGPMFCHFPHYGNQGGTPGCSMREGDYKLIEFFEDGRLELYNLRDDLSEDHDLARAEPDRAEAMRRSLVRWRESVGARIPEPNPNWQP